LINILITGGTGFIGSNLSKRFLSTKKYKILFILKSNKNLKSIKKYLNKKNHFILKLSKDFEKNLKTIKKFKPKVAIHLATKYIHTHEEKDIEEILNSNINFGTQVLELVSKSGCKNLINTSTVWEFYQSKEIPVNLYAATKSAFGRILSYYQSEYQLRCLTLMLSNTYGEKDERNKIIPFLLKNINKKSNLNFSNGSQILDFVHIDDVIDCYLLAVNKLLNSKRSFNYKYYLDGEYISLKNLVNLFQKTFDTKFVPIWGAIKRKRELMQPTIIKSDISLNWSKKRDIKSTFRSIKKNLE